MVVLELKLIGIMEGESVCDVLVDAAVGSARECEAAAGVGWAIGREDDGGMVGTAGEDGSTGLGGVGPGGGEGGGDVGVWGAREGSEVIGFVGVDVELGWVWMISGVGMVGGT